MATAVVVLLAGGVAVWLIVPSAFSPYGNGFKASGYRPGDDLYVNLQTRPHMPVTVRTVRPRIAAGAVAPMEFFACRRSAAGQFGAVKAKNIEEYCETLRPARGTALTPRGEWYLVGRLTLPKQGAVEIDGYEVTYDAGLRRGRDVTGIRTFLDPR